MKKIFAAVALATALSSGIALAQDDAAEMGEGLSMLEIAAERHLAQIGVTDVDVMGLTLNQLAQIKSVSEQSSHTTNERASQIRTIVASH